MSSQALFKVLVTLATLGVAFTSPVAAQAPAPPKTESPGAQTTPAPQTTSAQKPQVIPPKRFASPEEATQALVAALRAGDAKALLGVLGSEGRVLVSSGDPVADRRTGEAFVQAYDTAHKLVPAGAAMTLRIGEDDWALPIPLVKDGERWRFDPKQGRDEILARRIGRNELHTIQVCLAYVDAQREYYAQDRNGDGILEYAQRFASAPGKRDGLYWEPAAAEQPSPLGPLVVRARAEGYRRDKKEGPQPFNGYLYRILSAQGPDAPGGAYDYIVRGHMIAGFAMVAFPAQYGVSGVMTFIVNHDGVVYQKDLGPRTRSLATVMRMFNPDKTWTQIDAEQ